uniref:Ovule protein n=1 Tax=Brugia timori TaxID=42155 RepID=A0A0R3RDE4_9BILA
LSYIKVTINHHDVPAHRDDEHLLNSIELYHGMVQFYVVHVISYYLSHQIS